MIVLDSVIGLLGAAILLPEQSQNSPLNWTLQCADKKQEAGITPFTA